MDMNIKTAEANQWIKDVETEISCVEHVLNQVQACLEHDPDDDIWFEFERITKKLSLYWEGLTKASKKVCSVIAGVIKGVENAGKEIVDFVKNSEAQLRG